MRAFGCVKKHAASPRGRQSQNGDSRYYAPTDLWMERWRFAGFAASLLRAYGPTKRSGSSMLPNSSTPSYQVPPPPTGIRTNVRKTALIIVDVGPDWRSAHPYWPRILFRKADSVTVAACKRLAANMGRINRFAKKEYYRADCPSTGCGNGPICASANNTDKEIHGVI